MNQYCSFSQHMNFAIFDQFYLSQFKTPMLPNKNDIEITQDMSYSLTTRQINTPLKITNKSQQIYVYKVRTNQKKAINVEKTHDFLQPNTSVELFLALIATPQKSFELKLEIRYAIARKQDLQKNDSKMNNFPSNDTLIQIRTIRRVDNIQIPQEAHIKEETANKKQISLTDQISKISSHSDKEKKQQQQKEAIEISYSNEISSFKSFCEDPFASINRPEQQQASIPLQGLNMFKQNQCQLLQSYKEVVLAEIDAQDFVNGVEELMSNQNISRKQISPLFGGANKQSSRRQVDNPFSEQGQQDNLFNPSKIKIHHAVTQMMEEPQQSKNRQLQNILLSLKAKIRCSRDFISQLQAHQKMITPKIYPMHLFVLMSTCALLIGGLLSQDEGYL